MNFSKHRTIVEALQAEATAIYDRLLEELQSEGAALTPEEALAIGWTGQVRVFGQTVWHEFKTPGSWDGITYYRLPAIGQGGLKSREPDDMNRPITPEYDMQKAWQFVVDSYDPGFSPDRKDWTTDAILGFVDEHHVTGRESFRK